MRNHLEASGDWTGYRSAALAHDAAEEPGHAHQEPEEQDPLFCPVGHRLARPGAFCLPCETVRKRNGIWRHRDQPVRFDRPLPRSAQTWAEHEISKKRGDNQEAARFEDAFFKTRLQENTFGPGAPR